MTAYSHTTRQTFLSCPRKFYLGKMLRFERDVDPSGLRMGKAMADALEAADDGATLEDARSLAMALLDSRYEMAILAATHEGRANDVDRLRLEQVQLGVLIPAYIDRYHQSLLSEARAKGHTIVLTEREIEFDDPILGVGRLDAVASVAGRHVGIEDKLLTPGFWREANERQLRINAQVTAYFAAMREAGTPLDEIRYRVTFKPSIKPNSRTGETLTEYAKRLEGRVRTEEGYAFREYQLYRTDAELDAFVRRVEAVNRAIGRAKRDVKRYGEAAFPANFGTACTEFGECEFLELCIHGPSAPGYRIKPKRARLTPVQEEALGAMSSAFHPEVRVDAVSRVIGYPEQRTRDALNRLVALGLATKERRGRAAIYAISQQGKDRLAS